MSGEAPDLREETCLSHEACGGWCDLHQVMTEKDSSFLRHLLTDFKNTPNDFSRAVEEGDVTATAVMDGIQLIIRERLYIAWDNGWLAGVDYQGDGWNSDAHDHHQDNPYGWTGHRL